MLTFSGAVRKPTAASHSKVVSELAHLTLTDVRLSEEFQLIRALWGFDLMQNRVSVKLRLEAEQSERKV